MRTIHVLALAATIALVGCGAELLTTTAIQGELQAQNLKAVKGQVGYMTETTGKTNLQRAIDTYNAEKGRYPASLDELVPGYIASMPVHADGSAYGYDPATGRLLDAPAAPSGPTPNDFQKMNQIRNAINQYGTATGFYPGALEALVPNYLSALPQTDAGEDFLFNPQTGALTHPRQGAPTQTAAQPAPQRPRGGGSGVGPMGEVMTGIGVQQQLNSMGSSGSSAAGSYARGRLGDVTQQHNRQQERILNEMGN